jgi:hypothetical protein
MTECPDCGKDREQLGTHWAQSKSCEYPELTSEQFEIITGLLLGDGSINRGSGNPYVQCGMVNEDYLKYLDEKFPIMGTGVRMVESAEKSASKSTPLTPENDNPEKYNDVYQWITRSNPNLSSFSKWYKTGKKVWPENITLTPTILKHWYVGDGSLNKANGSPSIIIYTSKEINNKSKVEEYFVKANIPKPDNWSNSSMYWNKKHSIELLQYMGQPLPGFRYKWYDAR